jgi:tetratricopeptide (TPR) repeat protein
MKNIGSKIQQTLEERLTLEGLELVECLEIPAASDSRVRARTVEEALNDLEKTHGDAASYLVQVRNTAPKARVPDLDDETPVFDLQGDLNVPYLLQNASLLLSSREFALARNVYKAVLKSGKKSAQALFGVGLTFEGEGTPAKAVRCYEESIAYRPSPETFDRLIRVLEKLQRHEYAAELADRALALPDLTTAQRFGFHRSAAVQCVHAQDAENAERHLRAAIEIEPTQHALLGDLANLYLRSGRMSEAKRGFQEAIAGNPSRADFWCGLGVCLLREEDKQGAHDCFVRSLELDLTDATAVYYLIKCAYELKLYARAEELLSRYLDNTAANLSLLYSLAGLQYHLGKMREAQKSVDQILRMKPEHAGAKQLQQLLSRFASRRMDGNGRDNSRESTTLSCS